MNFLYIPKMFRVVESAPSARINFLMVGFLIIAALGLSASLSAQTTPSSASDAVLITGKQKFKNQLLMRELQLLRGHAPTSEHLQLVEHLKLDDSQKGELKQIDQEFQKEVGVVSGDRSLKITERARKIQSLLDDAERRMSEVLSPDQQKRLRQIALQSFGNAPDHDGLPIFNLFGHPDFKYYLDISEPTAALLKTKLQEEKLRLQKEIAKLKSETNQAVLSILSDEEKQRLADLLGEPFEFGTRPESGRSHTGKAGK
jgi:hypothetical protein